jgi:hypothetical protein
VMQYTISQQQDGTVSFKPEHDRTSERRYPSFGLLSVASQYSEVTSISSCVSRLVDCGTAWKTSEPGLLTDVMVPIELHFG